MIPTLQLGQAGRSRIRRIPPSTVKILAHMDGIEGGTQFRDDSSYGRSLGPVGGVHHDTTRSAFGGANAAMDGSFDGFSIADAAELRPGTGDFSIKFFYWCDSFANYVSLINKGYTTAGALLAQATITTGRIIVYLGGSAILTEPGSALTVGQRYFIEISRLGGTLALYRDGSLRASASNSTNLNSTAVLYAGGGSSTGFNNYFLPGGIDEFVYDVGTATDVGVVPTEPFWS